MFEVLPLVNYWLLIFAGSIILVLEVLTLKRWMKILGLSLVIVGGISLGFGIQDGLFQLVWLLVIAGLLYRLGKNHHQTVRISDEHLEGGTGVITRADGEMRVIYKNTSWPIVTDEEQLHPGDHVVVQQIVDGRATVELLSRKSVHAKN